MSKRDALQEAEAFINRLNDLSEMLDDDNVAGGNLLREAATRLASALEDARIMKNNWHAACNDLSGNAIVLKETEIERSYQQGLAARVSLLETALRGWLDVEAPIGYARKYVAVRKFTETLLGVKSGGPS